jgi:hypothetical protein
VRVGRGLKHKAMGREEVLQAHLYILDNTNEVQPYLAAHNVIVKDRNPRMSEKWLLNEHNKPFLKWFSNKVFIVSLDLLLFRVTFFLCD